MRSSHSAPLSASRPQGRTCSRCQSSWATPYPSPYMPCLRPGFSSQCSPKAHPSVPPHRHLQPGSTRLFRRLSPLPFVSQKISRIVSRKTATRFVSQEIAVTHFWKTTCATHNRVILGKCVRQKCRQRQKFTTEHSRVGEAASGGPLPSSNRTGGFPASGFLGWFRRGHAQGVIDGRHHSRKPRHCNWA